MPMMILREYGTTPRFHGNGFTQLPLRDNRRLHVWHPSLPPIAGHNATIHNHVWDMQSRVLLGSLTHRTLFVNPRAEADHDMYVVHCGDAGPDEYAGQAYVEVVGEYHMAAGSIYVFPAGQFHESESPGVTATIIEKRPRQDFAERPVVLCPRGERPVDAFAPEHQPPVDDMWAVIEEAVLEMCPHTRLELKSCLGS